MGYLKLNRFGNASGAVFEPEEIIEKVRRAFPGANILAGDQLAQSAARAAEAGAPSAIVQRLRRNQEEYGPAYAFEIPLDGASPIEGRARRFDVTFLFRDPLPNEWHERLLAFLKDLGAGNVESMD